jgi:ubiquinone/menaquinone biosynthesis C-methylase UbiE
MTWNVHHDLQKDQLRERLATYTRQAFQMLPQLENPAILDIGCGTGVPTLELARLCNGLVIGVDINQECLDELARKAEAAGLSGRVKTLKRSLFELDFPDESFDILWAEGSIAIIGFERGLKEWRRLLKPDGFLGIHDEIGNLPQKLSVIRGCGYELLGYFILSAETWWQDYYGPLERRIRALRERYGQDPRALAAVAAEEREVEMVKSHPEQYASVFLVMQQSA